MSDYLTLDLKLTPCMKGEVSKLEVSSEVRNEMQYDVLKEALKDKLGTSNYEFTNEISPGEEYSVRIMWHPIFDEFAIESELSEGVENKVLLESLDLLRLDSLEQYLKAMSMSKAYDN
ncbi:hypothetical protein KY321_01480 [Candidatus Woesearchaeota archaeon]|nr:hypothetical protein [Candidatus Woesearchaeota archaeon]